jgi:hypothetical protein
MKLELSQTIRFKFQPKTSESYRAIINALSEKCTECHTYKLKEERNYRGVLKNMHYSINTQGIKAEVEKLGHTVTISGILNNTELSYHSPCFL